MFQFVNAAVTPSRNSASRKSRTGKLTGTWFSRGSYGVYVTVTGLRGCYGVYVAVTGLCPAPFGENCLAWLLRDIFLRNWVGRGSLEVDTGSMWLLRDLRGCYGIYVAVTGLCPAPFWENCLVWQAPTGRIFAKLSGMLFSRGSYGVYTWLLRDLRGCYGVMSRSFLRKLPGVAGSYGTDFR